MKLDVITGTDTLCLYCMTTGKAIVSTAVVAAEGPSTLLPPCPQCGNRHPVGICEDCTIRIGRFWHARGQVLGQVLGDRSAPKRGLF